MYSKFLNTENGFLSPIQARKKFIQEKKFSRQGEHLVR